MRKSLSIIICIAMIFSLMAGIAPVGSANFGNDYVSEYRFYFNNSEAPENSDMQSGTYLNWGYEGAYSDDATYQKQLKYKDVLASYNDNGRDWKVVDPVASAEYTTTNSSGVKTPTQNPRFMNYGTVIAALSRGYNEIGEDGWTVYKIRNVPTGKNIAKLEYMKGNGGVYYDANVYMIPGATAKTDIPSVSAATGAMTTVNFYDANAGGVTVDSTKYSAYGDFETTKADAGEMLFAIKMSTANSRNGYIKKLTVYNENKNLKAGLSFDSDRIDVGGAANASVALEGDVLYESQNEAIATVDEKGVITGVSNGATRIKATVLTDNGYASEMKYISVGEKTSLTHTVNFASAYEEFTTGEKYMVNANNVITYPNYYTKYDAGRDWKFVTPAPQIYLSGNSHGGNWGLRMFTEGGNAALRIRIPYAKGVWTVTNNFNNGTTNKGGSYGPGLVYLFPSSTVPYRELTTSGSNLVADAKTAAAIKSDVDSAIAASSQNRVYDCTQYSGTDDKNVDVGTITIDSSTPETDDGYAEFIYAFKTTSTKSGYKRLLVHHTVFEDVTVQNAKMKVSKSTMESGESASASVSTLDTTNNTAFTDYDSVVYKSSNPAVATVNASTGEIVAVSSGDAIISAEITHNLDSATLQMPIKVQGDEAPSAVSLYATATNGVDNSNISVVIGEAAAISGGTVESVEPGTAVTVTAAQEAGNYEFKYWLGSAGFVSSSLEYTFDIYSNTSLKAVYAEKPAEDEVSVQFFNQNRETLQISKIAKGTAFGAITLPTTPTLTGYSNFLGWYRIFNDNEEKVEDSLVVDNDLNVVAQFENAAAVSAFTINGVDQGAVSYGTEFAENSADANFSYWTRNGNIVSYNPEYTFYAWQDNAEVVAVKNGATTAKPVALLEKYGDAFMFEYEIPAGCTRVEAGIVFGDSSSISVESCMAKAVSRKNVSRGQFTAKSDYTYARGYVIYKDGANVLRVAYSD